MTLCAKNSDIIKRILINASALLALLFCQTNYANPTGLLFNVTPDGTTLNVKTVIPNHTYPTAGIKINTAGYNIASGCTPDSNGYCIFPVSDTQPTALSISGPTGTMNAILCLSGRGPLSCQHFDNVSINSNTVKTAKFAYVASYSYSGPYVLVCNLDPTTGFITTCTDTGQDSTFTGIPLEGIVINNTSTVAYISNGNGNPATPYVYQCQINPTDGTFSSCSTTSITTPTGYDPYYGMLTLNPTNTLAYLVDYNNGAGRVLACPISNDVISGNCADTGATSISDFATGIVLNKAGTTAYVGNDSTPPGVVVCAVNGSSFSSCILKTGGTLVDSTPFTFSGVGGVVLNNTESILYIAENSFNIVYGCPTTPSGSPSFSNCFIATSAVIAPWGITVDAKNTIAYITDFNTTTYSCPINSDGTYGACALYTGISSPTGIAMSY